MSYLAPAEFVTKMVDSGESKVFMSTRDTLIRAYMAGAILAFAAAFAVTVGRQCRRVPARRFALPGRLLPPLPSWLRPPDWRLHARPACLVRPSPGDYDRGHPPQLGSRLRRELRRRAHRRVFIAIIFTAGFTTEPDAVGRRIGVIGESRTAGYSEAGWAGMLTLFIRAP